MNFRKVATKCCASFKTDDYMTISELDRLLSSQNLDFELIHHEKPIKSRNDALNLFRLEEMAPTLILQTEKGMIALIISGAREKIDFTKIGNALECTSVKMADKHDVVEKLGMNPGEVAMVGHRLPCVIDNRIFNSPYIYGGTGDARVTLKINPHHLLTLNNVILKFD